MSQPVKDNVVYFPKAAAQEPAGLDPATALSCLRTAILDLEDVYRLYGVRGGEARNRASLNRALAMASFVRKHM